MERDVHDLFTNYLRNSLLWFTFEHFDCLLHTLSNMHIHNLLVDPLLHSSVWCPSHNFDRFFQSFRHQIVEDLFADAFRDTLDNVLLPCALGLVSVLVLQDFAFASSVESFRDCATISDHALIRSFSPVPPASTTSDRALFVLARV